ncbi:uridine kinase [Cytobacillus purgationiresistens]|uniref:Uridine kinase n=1 Tax=Cytobacillus purgationiresistens TaxID=863449 RepID=A0ABU0AB37_9BACI|nr:uridine kinase [Cytobacillus purgationiresistens]MDQ0268466.1 uridine kinase [Cytobacillus purgationiresistens]
MQNKPLIISISGISGSGKTTVSNELASRLGGAKVIHYDDYDIEGPVHFGKWALEGGDYNDWNVQPIVSDLHLCLANKSIEFIILDYPFAKLNNQLEDLISFSFYIDTPLDIAMARRFLRNPIDSANELILDCENYLATGRKAYMVMENKIKPNADFLINGQLPVEEIALNMVKKLLLGISYDN